MTVSPLLCERWAAKAPANLCLCSDEALFNLCRRSREDAPVFGAALGEMLARWFVGDAATDGQLSLEGEILRWMPDGRLPERLLSARISEASRADVPVLLESVRSLWNSCDGETGRVIGDLVARRLDMLLNRTDGFVPVFDPTDGRSVFVPFRLVPRPANTVAAMDLSGCPVEGWVSAAERVLGREWTMSVAIHQRRDTPSLCGSSFMLPLLVAKLRREGRLPSFAPWQLLFTGSIAPDGSAMPVQTEEKVAGVRARFQKGVRLVAPSDAAFADETRGVDPIPSGLCGDDLLRALRRKVEALSSCGMSRNYALSRLPEFAIEMRHETYGKWDRQIARVDAMLRVLGRHSAPEQHLLLLMLKSAAYCHSGRTEEALRVNRQAQDFARENGLVGEALRLEIEAMVDFQDSQRFDDISRVSEGLWERIRQAELPDEKRLDLLMRYHGTMGQIQMELALLGVDDDAREESRRSVNAALAAANRLGRDGDILQDLNYLGLWFALFDPDAEEFAEIANEAHGLCQGLESDGERIKNEAYLARILLTADYVRWRRSGVVPAGWEAHAELPRGCEDWLPATCFKMKGALLVASGRINEGRDAFRDGERILPFREWWQGTGDDVLFAGSVYAQIRLELLVQAYCSLLSIGDEVSALEYAGHARRLLAMCPDVVVRGRVGELAALIEGASRADPRTFPLLYY